MPAERSCEICGCTDKRACVGGCSWVDAFRDANRWVCSACVFKAWELVAQVPELSKFVPVKAEELEQLEKRMVNALGEVEHAIAARDIARAEAFTGHVTLCRRLSELLELGALASDLVDELVVDEGEYSTEKLGRIALFRARYAELTGPGSDDDEDGDNGDDDEEENVG